MIFRILNLGLAYKMLELGSIHISNDFLDRTLIDLLCFSAHRKMMQGHLGHLHRSQQDQLNLLYHPTLVEWTTLHYSVQSPPHMGLHKLRYDNAMHLYFFFFLSLFIIFISQAPRTILLKLKSARHTSASAHLIEVKCIIFNNF